MKTLIATLLFCWTFSAIAQNEVTYYDQGGNATHYIDFSKGTVYTFSGIQVGFLEPKARYYNIYNSQGRHLGWLEQGVIRDHEGEVVGFQSNALTNVLIKPQPLKGLKGIEPLPPTKELEPLKPLYSSRFSKTSLTPYFAKSTSIARPANNPYNNQAVVPNIQPFQPDLNLLGNVLSALQARHDNLINAGFFYDVETQTYIAPQDFESFRQTRIDNLKTTVVQYTNAKYFKQRLAVEDGQHRVYYLNAEAAYPVVYTGLVVVKKGEIKKMLINDKTIKMIGRAKIDNGMAAAKMKQNFGFFNGTVEYPMHLFLFTE